MTAVDFAAIQKGDKVKIRYRGLESTDWMLVTNDHGRALEIAGNWYAYPRSDNAVEFIAHQPAPRKVEVTLGEPLPFDPRQYPAAEPNYSRFYAARSLERAVYLATGDGESTILDHTAARQLALDILATVGVEE